jgi:hypothetical protein
MYLYLVVLPGGCVPLLAGDDWLVVSVKMKIFLQPLERLLSQLLEVVGGGVRHREQDSSKMWIFISKNRETVTPHTQGRIMTQSNKHDEIVRKKWNPQNNHAP